MSISKALRIAGNVKTGWREQSGFEKFTTAVALYETVVPYVRDWRERRVNNSSYSVTIPGDDIIYPLVCGWIAENVPSPSQREFTIKTQRKTIPGFDGWEKNAQKNVVYRQYDGSTIQTVQIGGHAVKIGMDRPTLGDMMVTDIGGRMNNYISKEKIIITASSTEAREAVLKWLAELAETNTSRTPTYYVCRKYGGWDTRKTPVRPFETVVLPRDQKETIISDIDRFLRAEKDYISWGMPYHRGYLLYGPPGTGKTSTAIGIASYFNLDTYYIPLATLENDAALLDAMETIGPNSILLLEDIDVIKAARDRTGDEDGVTLQGLLNVLDGSLTPHGVIVIMTTNHAEVLEPALVRPGRVDMSIEVGYLTQNQLEDICQTFLGFIPELPKIGPDVTPAEAINSMKFYMDDAQGAAKALVEFIEGRNA